LGNSTPPHTPTTALLHVLQATPELTTTALSVLSALHNGVGSALGGFIGGQLFAAGGARVLWRTGFEMACVGLVLLAVAAALKRREEPPMKKL
jgi:predicted MFS family arabinose efflux permease